jgi:hypothetical protein
MAQFQTAGGGGGPSFPPAAPDGSVQYNNAGAFGPVPGSSVASGLVNFDLMDRLNGLRQATYAPVLMPDSDVTIRAAQGSFFDYLSPITANLTVTLETDDAPRTGIVVAVRRFDKSAFSVTIQRADTTPLWVFATGESGEVDLIFTGADYDLAGARLFQLP